MIRTIKVSNKVRGAEKLKEVSISVEEGDFCILFGGDNSGKTTLLHILLGFDIAYYGKISILGTKPNRLDGANRKKLRYVPDNLIREDGITGKQYLEMASEVDGNYSKVLEKKMCEIFQLDVDKPISQMTWSENKLTQLVAAVAAVPKLLVLDEPKNFLEDDIYRKVIHFLEQLHKSGMTILLLAEKYEDAFEYANRFIYMKEGKVIAQGPVPIREYPVRKVTVTLDEVSKSYLYEGDIARVGEVMSQAGFTDWTIENISFQEELDIRNAEEI